MNLSERDKKVAVIGGVLALAIVVLGYGVIPVLRGWSGSNATLSSKAAYVSDLRERIDSQETLVKQRNALALRIGSLFEAPNKPEPKKDAAATSQSPESPKPETKPKDAVASVTPESPKPETKPIDAAVAKMSPESPKPETKPGEKQGDEKSKPEAATGATLAGYVEQNAKKAEATVKSITPAKTSNGIRSTHYYRPVMLQVKVKCKAKGLVAFLQALENGERFVKIEQVQIHREANKDDMDVTLDVRAYESTGKAS